MSLSRCAWVSSDPIYIDYHDNEWGKPITGEDALFERISLEGFQAGLSWLTILKRREGLREAFLSFKIADVAKMPERDVERLLTNEGIIRHRGKIQAVINNARIIQENSISLEELIQKHTPTEDRRNLTVSPESTALSNELRKLGFNFVGPTTMHAMLQATGVIQDHEDSCEFRNN
jgi:DNA-3-methyladenine glycosylase I